MTLKVGRRDDATWLLAFAAGHVAIFAGLFRGAYTMPFSGTGLYYEYGSALVAGQVPYRDFLVEYPPFALVFFTLPRLIDASFRWYYVAYQAQVVLFDLVALGALYVARDRSRPAWWMLGAYTAAVLAVGPIMLQQYDVFPAAFTVLAVVCYSRKRDTAAWVFLALGVMTKAYPLLIAPVFLLFDWRRGTHVRDLRRAAVAFAGTCFVVVLPLLVIAPTSLARMLAFHAERGIHLDSTYGSLAAAAGVLNVTLVHIELTFRSWNVAGPFASTLSKLSTPLLGVLLLGAYAFIATCIRAVDAANLRDARLVGTCAALVLSAGLVGSKVLSPQYLVWLVPLLPLMLPPRRYAAWGVFALIGILTYYIYPLHYPELLQLNGLAIAALAVRNLLLVTLTLVVADSLRLATRSPAAQ
ncbi:MAG: glycosyltransferase family 87 protein [bacterium]